MAEIIVSRDIYKGNLEYLKDKIEDGVPSSLENIGTELIMLGYMIGDAIRATFVTKTEYDGDPFIIKNNATPSYTFISRGQGND